MAEIGVEQPLEFALPAGLLLAVSDLGLCGDYNVRLVQAAVEQNQRHGGGPLYCTGRRAAPMLARYNMKPQRQYAAASSVDGLPRLLLRLAEDMLDDFTHRLIGSLYVVSARFEGAGHFVPMVTQVLPIRPARPEVPIRRNRYQSVRRLEAVAAREYLYTTLYELLLDALASEHGMRLLAAESARQWIEESSRTVHRQLLTIGREAATQELLDIVAGSRHPRDTTPRNESLPGS